MIRHPDGLDLTERLLQTAEAEIGSSILDMGAGDGETVRFLLQCGYQAVGLDKVPGQNVIQGDMTNLPFPAESFEYVLSECSFSVCGDTAAAFREARRVLCSGGRLLLSDVYFRSGQAATLSLPIKADEQGWMTAAEGFRRIFWEDCSEEWLQFLIHCIWNGTDLGDCGYYKQAAKAKAGYFLSVWEKE